MERMKKRNRFGRKSGRLEEMAPIPYAVTSFNRRALNHVTRHMAGWAPGFGILTHTGRRSGRVYHTPLNVFRDGDGYRIALTYGPDTDWLRNIQAAGKCDLLTRGRTYHLANPQLLTDSTRRWLPPPARLLLGLIGASQYVRLTVAAPAPAPRP
jgi:deazaflavin-dependent oxidoreductase (nitroreductase family)